MRACIAALAAFIALDGACAVYKDVDAEGRVRYSDKPPAGAAAIGPAAPDAFDDLRGSWKVGSMTFEGAPRIDEKLAGSTWSFESGQVVIQRLDGQKARYAVRTVASANPRTFNVTPIEPANERGGAMIYERQAQRLRIAFFDNLEGRPAGFGPAPKLIVLNLLAATGAGVDARAQPSACDILRAAGVDALLGPNAEVDPRRAPDPSAQCRLVQPSGGSAALALMFASSRSALDKQHEHERELARTRAMRTIVQDEPELGPSAFSVHMGNDVIFWTLKRDTLVALAFAVPPAAHDALLPFVRRVLARL